MSRNRATDALPRHTAYSLAAGAAATLASSQAEAQIIWSGPQDIAIAQFNSQTLDLDGDYYNDVLLKNYVFGGKPYQGANVQYFPGLLVAKQLVPNGIAYARALSTGDVIDAATVTPGINVGSMAYGTTNPNAEFNNAVGAFLGMSFPINATAHYGWVRVTIDNAGGTFVINDWAYNNTPGEGIRAGQIAKGDFNDDGLVDVADYTVWRDTLDSTSDLRADGDADGAITPLDYLEWQAAYGFPPLSVSSSSVPEPTTLGLLAAGAVGLATLRRGRQATREQRLAKHTEPGR
ncbi:PEP-CTERM sorting domain-containing protein [Botrimarina hoheduenensis]|uniref:Ice-binding protein C-terminal domain-containing protein n=1 Tax=Botrimarina hoheduenensis TaxID=2528000 RepID=A0A5C5WBW4_9BACT|nr:PEP-CTERM sorting domain-containing protein [Botrimarina hoheduenensis]TWT47551.1 hypothetical protein Pla111_11660 [Botrimarina hoheduenensis]